MNAEINLSVSQKAVRVAGNLLKATQDRACAWFPVRDTSGFNRGTQDLIEGAYVCSFDDSKFAIWGRSYRAVSDDGERYWAYRPELYLMDDDGNPIWRFPDDAVVRALYEAVVLSAEKVEDQLDRLLAKSL